MSSTKILLPLLTLSFAITGCGGSGSGDPYKIGEDNYLALRGKLLSPRIFLDMNLSFTAGNQNFKIADSKFDGYVEGERSIISFDASTYEKETTQVQADTYYYDESDKVWYHESEKAALASIYNHTSLYFLSALPSSYDQLSYNESKHKYSATVNMEGELLAVELGFENGNLISYKVEADGTFLIDFYDYGKTVVNIPTEYQESN